MKVCFKGINYIFDTEEDINTLIVENPSLLLDILKDIQNEIDGNEGSTIVSLNNKPLDISKNVELITQFVPFNINQKHLLNKVNAELEKKLIEPERYPQSLEVISSIEKLLLDASFEMVGDFAFSKLTIASMAKAAGLEIVEDYDCLGEAIIDYIELVNEYEHDKLFIFYNLRSLMDENEVSMFYDTCIRHKYNIICLESSIHPKICYENIVIIDHDLCEIIG